MSERVVLLAYILKAAADQNGDPAVARVCDLEQSSNYIVPLTAYPKGSLFTVGEKLANCEILKKDNFKVIDELSDEDKKRIQWSS